MRKHLWRLLAEARDRAVTNRVLIQPSVREYDSHREQYDALVSELQTEEVLVRIVSPSEEHKAWESEPGRALRPHCPHW